MPDDGGSPAKRRWQLSAKGLAGLVAFITGAVTLAFTLSPALKPDPGNAVNAKLDVLAIEPATYRQWVARLGDTSGTDDDPELLDSRGFIVYLQVEVAGRKRKDLRLVQSRYLTGPDRRYKPQVPAQEAATFRSETPSDRWVALLFANPPPAKGKFFERYELYDHHTLLSFADTPARPGNP